MRSLCGREKNIFCRSAVRVSFEPINSANICRCFFSSTITSGEGGENFSATFCDLSRVEKFSVKMKIQMAASAAHALGCGQKMVESRAAKVEGQRLSCRRLSILDPRPIAAAKISARHSPGIFFSGWREIFCSKFSIFVGQASCLSPICFFILTGWKPVLLYFFVKWTQPRAQFV